MTATYSVSIPLSELHGRHHDAEYVEKRAKVKLLARLPGLGYEYVIGLKVVGSQQFEGIKGPYLVVDLDG